MSRPEDDRRVAFGTDRNPAEYARRRARAARRRAALDRRSYDPRPPGEDDWAVPDRSQMARVPRGPEHIGHVLDEPIDPGRFEAMAAVAESIR